MKKELTVKALSSLSGVSVRTLHYYDEIGLLKPLYTALNGYRYYGEEEVLILQQILFFREMDLSLKSIQKILGKGHIAKLEMLASHKVLMEKRIKRQKLLLKTIDQTMKHLKGEVNMSYDETFSGFFKEKQEEYEQFLIDKYGEAVKENIAESKRRTKDWKSEQFRQAKDDADRINNALVELINKGLKPDSAPVQAVMKDQHAWITQFWDPTPKAYKELGELYVSHGEFHEMLKSKHSKLPEFLREAMEIFASNLV